MKAICKKFPQTLMFLGLAGSGKDTQADKICELCDGVKISTGLLAREEIERNTKLGKIADRCIKNGILIPDKVIHKILRNGLTNLDNNKLWVFTGVVRTVEQIKMFDETLSLFNRNLGKVIFLELSEKSVVNRLSKRRFCPKCGATYHPDYKKSKKEGYCDVDNVALIQRDDDKPDVIKTRLREQKYEIKEILAKYSERGILLRVDGEPSIEEIHKNLVKTFSNEG